MVVLTLPYSTLVCSHPSMKLHGWATCRTSACSIADASDLFCMHAADTYRSNLPLNYTDGLDGDCYKLLTLCIHICNLPHYTWRESVKIHCM